MIMQSSEVLCGLENNKADKTVYWEKGDWLTEGSQELPHLIGYIVYYVMFLLERDFRLISLHYLNN